MNNDCIISDADANSLGACVVKDMMGSIRLLNFEPLRLLGRLREYAANGHAALVVIDHEIHPHLIWSYSIDNELSRLMILRQKGSWIVGYICFSPSGEVTCYPEEQPRDDAPVFSFLLNYWAQLYRADPQQQAKRELDEFVQTTKNAVIDGNVLDCFDALKDKFPEMAKTLDCDPSDFNFQH